MLNKRVQTLFDQATWQLVHESAINMNISFGEALRQAANYAFKTKKIHKVKDKKVDLRAELAAIHKDMKPLHLSFKEIKEMVEYGRRY
jgi:hypothetical protein